MGKSISAIPQLESLFSTLIPPNDNSIPLNDNDFPQFDNRFPDNGNDFPCYSDASPIFRGGFSTSHSRMSRCKRALSAGNVGSPDRAHAVSLFFAAIREFFWRERFADNYAH